MKQSLATVILFFISIICSYSQNDTTSSISFDGFYIAKTGSIAAANIDIHTYFRFYRDGSVYLQTVTSNDPQAVSDWFGRYKKFSQKGTYKINETTIFIQLTNKESKDFKLEGLQETVFNGIIKSNNQLCLTKNEESEQNCFDFSKVSDTTKIKYSLYKSEIKLPGEWKIKQILNNGQVFFINEDSTEIGIAVFKASNLDVYKETQTDFETAYAYYEWDSEYMAEERKMEVTKISENKEKAFVLWNAKVPHNDSYYLFGKNKELLYNIMIFDKKMPLEKKLIHLETLYDLNKE